MSYAVLVLGMAGSVFGDTAAYQALVQAESGLQHYYSFDGADNAARRADKKGSADFSEFGSAATPGYGAAGFDGSSDAVTVSSLTNGFQTGSVVDLDDMAVTVHVLIRPDADIEAHIFQAEDTGGRSYFAIENITTGEDLYTAVGTGSWPVPGRGVYAGNGSLQTGHWYFLAATYTIAGGTTDIVTYIADLTAGDTTLTTSPVVNGSNGTYTTASGNAFTVGSAYWDATAYQFDGAIDELAVFGGAQDTPTIQTYFDGLLSTNKAWNPNPKNTAEDIAINLTLTWRSGMDANSHDIYFGTDYDQVNGAIDPYTLPGRGNQLLGNESYTPGLPLDYSTPYFWRIDEVNGGDTVRGPIWSFDVTNSDPTTCEGMLSLGFGSTVDFDNNCNYNLADLAALASEWLSQYDMVDVSFLAGKWLDCDDPEDDNCKRPWQELARTCVDTLINFGTDTYGPVHTPMLMSIINVETLTSPQYPLGDVCPSFWCEGDYDNDIFYDACMRTEGRPCHGRLSPSGSNAWLDQPTIKAMYLCSVMTGDPTYSDAADDYLSYFMNYCRKGSGLFYWGSHSYWHAFNETYGGDGVHEILIKHPDWDNLYRLNPGAVGTEVDAIWNYHVRDHNTGNHNRHDKAGTGDFCFSGGSFAMAFSFMYNVTGQQHYLDKAKLIDDWHWQSRDPVSNVMPDHVGSNYLYAYNTSPGPYAAQLLRCYELTGDTIFRDHAVSYINTFEQYAWNEQDRNYFSQLLLDGTPVVNDPDPWHPNGYVDVWRTIMYTYEFPLIAAQSAVYAYEITGGDPNMLTTALHWAEVIERNLPPYLGRRWKNEIEATLSDVLKTEGTYAENYGRCISFFVHLYRATQDAHYLQLAEEVATEAVEKLYTNGIFKGHPAKPYYQSNDGIGFLLYALLELQEPDVHRKGAF